jgi:predicted lipoprotein
MFRKSLLLIFAIGAVGAVGAGPAHADFNPAAYRALNEQLVREHILPRYARFAQMAAQFATVAGNACDMPSTASVETLRKAALLAQDAWQAVQHIRFGPIEQDMRSTRLAFWPDVRNRIGRELDEMLAHRDRSQLKPEQFAEASIVVQGFPVLERLLFDENAGRLLIDGTVDAHYRCALVRAIAENIASVADQVYAEWSQGDDSYANEIAEAGGDFALYRKPEEATLELFKSMHAALEIVADHKLARPMGDSIDSARSTRAEAWRSGRSLDNIRRNIEAASAMYLGEAGDGSAGFSRFVREVAQDVKLDKLLQRAFRQTAATANAIDMPLSEAIGDPLERPKLEKLKTETTALKALLAQRLTAAMAIPLGFNALDGD